MCLCYSGESSKMFWFKWSLLLAVLVTCVIERSSAIECYLCDSSNPACNEPFVADKVDRTCTKQTIHVGNMVKPSAPDAATCVKSVTKNEKGNKICPFLNIRGTDSHL